MVPLDEFSAPGNMLVSVKTHTLCAMVNGELFIYFGHYLSAEIKYNTWKEKKKI